MWKTKNKNTILISDNKTRTIRKGLIVLINRIIKS